MAATAVAALLGGCQTLGSLDGLMGGGEPEGLDARLAQAGAHGVPPSDNVIASAAYWGTRYQRDPRNAEAAVHYAQALRAVNSLPAALEVLQRADSLNPGNPAIMAELGKTLTAAGRPAEAMPLLDQARALDPQNWKTLVASGVALDQSGRHVEAQQLYMDALRIAPGEPSIYNNLGLSLALDGKLEEAELAMRKAVATPAATARMRHNLALVLGLRGEDNEAVRLSAAPIPPAAAGDNTEEIREMLSQPALWAREAHADNNPIAFE